MVIGEKQSFAGERPAQSQWESRIHAIVLGRETPNDGGMSSTAQITIVFTDNDSDLKAALCAALEDAGADHVERCVRKGSWAAATFTPDVVVIDVTANLQRNLEQLTQVELDFPAARLLMASLHSGRRRRVHRETRNTRRSAPDAGRIHAGPRSHHSRTGRADTARHQGTTGCGAYAAGASSSDAHVNWGDDQQDHCAYQHFRKRWRFLRCSEARETGCLTQVRHALAGLRWKCQIRSLKNTIACVAAQQSDIGFATFDFNDVRTRSACSLAQPANTNCQLSPPSPFGHPDYWRRVSRFLSSWAGYIKLAHTLGKSLQALSSGTVYARARSMRVPSVV